MRKAAETHLANRLAPGPLSAAASPERHGAARNSCVLLGGGDKSARNRSLLTETSPAPPEPGRFVSLKQFALGPALRCSCPHHPPCQRGTGCTGIHARAGTAAAPTAACRWQQSRAVCPPCQPAHLTATAWLSERGMVRRTRDGPTEGPHGRGRHGPRGLSFLVTPALILTLSSGWHGDGDGDGDGVSLPSRASSHTEGRVSRGRPWPGRMSGKRMDPKDSKG